MSVLHAIHLVRRILLLLLLWQGLPGYSSRHGLIIRDGSSTALRLQQFAFGLCLLWVVTRCLSIVEAHLVFLVSTFNSRYKKKKKEKKTGGWNTCEAVSWPPGEILWIKGRVYYIWLVFRKRGGWRAAEFDQRVSRSSAPWQLPIDKSGDEMLWSTLSWDQFISKFRKLKLCGGSFSSRWAAPASARQRVALVTKTTTRATVILPELAVTTVSETASQGLHLVSVASLRDKATRRRSWPSRVMAGVKNSSSLCLSSASRDTCWPKH